MSNHLPFSDEDFNLLTWGEAQWLNTHMLLLESGLCRNLEYQHRSMLSILTRTPQLNARHDDLRVDILGAKNITVTVEAKTEWYESQNCTLELVTNIRPNCLPAPGKYNRGDEKWDELISLIRTVKSSPSIYKGLLLADVLPAMHYTSFIRCAPRRPQYHFVFDTYNLQQELAVMVNHFPLLVSTPRPLANGVGNVSNVNLLVPLDYLLNTISKEARIQADDITGRLDWETEAMRKLLPARRAAKAAIKQRADADLTSVLATCPPRP